VLSDSDWGGSYPEKSKWRPDLSNIEWCANPAILPRCRWHYCQVLAQDEVLQQQARRRAAGHGGAAKAGQVGGQRGVDCVILSRPCNELLHTMGEYKDMEGNCRFLGNYDSSPPLRGLVFVVPAPRPHLLLPRAAAPAAAEPAQGQGAETGSPPRCFASKSSNKSGMWDARCEVGALLLGGVGGHHAAGARSGFPSGNETAKHNFRPSCQFLYRCPARLVGCLRCSRCRWQLRWRSARRMSTGRPS
jgi:hypothetical protein